MTDNEELENLNDGLIEEYLLFLRGRGPEPDLSDLPPGRREVIREQFKILKALADRGSKLPPLEQDPVARRLGLVRPGASSSALIVPRVGRRDAGAGDLLEGSLDEVAFRFQGCIVIERAAAWSADAPDGMRALAQCAVLAEAVAVFVGDTDARADLPERLQRFFRLRPEVSAVCVSSPDAERAVVFSPADVTRSLHPALGWLDPHRPNPPEPLALALSRFFEQRLPRWDRVAAADVFGTMDALDAEAAAVLDAQIASALRARPRLEFRKDGQRVLAERCQVGVGDLHCAGHAANGRIPARQEIVQRRCQRGDLLCHRGWPCRPDDFIAIMAAGTSALVLRRPPGTLVPHRSAYRMLTHLHDHPPGAARAAGPVLRCREPVRSIREHGLLNVMKRCASGLGFSWNGHLPSYMPFLELIRNGGLLRCHPARP